MYRPLLALCFALLPALLPALVTAQEPRPRPAPGEKSGPKKWDDMTQQEKDQEAKRIKDTAATFAGLGVATLLGFACLALVGFIIQLIPGIIASMRGHSSAAAIWCLCIFLGWTGVGWILALVWSLADPTPKGATVIVDNRGSGARRRRSRDDYDD